jgi:hypothetical protein
MPTKFLPDVRYLDPRTERWRKVTMTELERLRDELGMDEVMQRLAVRREWAERFLDSLDLPPMDYGRLH